MIGIRLGPIDVSRLTLIREAPGMPYVAHAEGAVTGTPIPIDLRAEIESDEGRPRATSIRGSVAGFPAGVLIDFIVAALASRL